MIIQIHSLHQPPETIRQRMKSPSERTSGGNAAQPATTTFVVATLEGCRMLLPTRNGGASMLLDSNAAGFGSTFLGTTSFGDVSFYRSAAFRIERFNGFGELKRS